MCHCHVIHVYCHIMYRQLLVWTHWLLLRLEDAHCFAHASRRLRSLAIVWFCQASPNQSCSNHVPCCQFLVALVQSDHCWTWMSIAVVLYIASVHRCCRFISLHCYAHCVHSHVINVITILFVRHCYSTYFLRLTVLPRFLAIPLRCVAILFACIAIVLFECYFTIVHCCFVDVWLLCSIKDDSRWNPTITTWSQIDQTYTTNGKQMTGLGRPDKTERNIYLAPASFIPHRQQMQFSEVGITMMKQHQQFWK